MMRVGDDIRHHPLSTCYDATAVRMPFVTRVGASRMAKSFAVKLTISTCMAALLQSVALPANSASVFSVCGPFSVQTAYVDSYNATPAYSPFAFRQ